VIAFNNPFKYEDGLEGFLYTYFVTFLWWVDESILLSTFTIVQTGLAINFVAWYNKKKMV
jgi:hypothetical protein